MRIHDRSSPRRVSRQEI